MNRNSLFGRLVDNTGSQADRPEHHRMRLEPLEDRKMLALTVYHNDNWVNVSDPGNAVEVGDFVTNTNDTINPGGIFAEYGIDAYGTVDGSSVPGFELIHDAIQGTDNGGVLNLLEGTYTESDIVIDRAMDFVGADPAQAESLIVPEVASSGDMSNFGPGTHSGIIVYSATVTVTNVRLDGNGNGSLGGSLNYHQGITTLYDTQNGGDYSSLRNGDLPVIQLGPIANQQRSIPGLRFQNVTVDNTFWHGITLAAPQGKVYGESDTGLDIQDATVNNVGDGVDMNRIGILGLNLDNSPLEPSSNVLNSTVNGAGVGVSLKVFGPPFDYADNDGARNKSGVSLTTVNNATFRAFEIEFSDGQEANLGNVANWSGANNATGIYMNYGNPLLSQFLINGAKIGIHIQNSPEVAGGGPVMYGGAVITGPGTGVAGSVGLLIDNDSTFTDSSNMIVAPSNVFTNFETGVLIQQTETPGDGLPSVLSLDRVNVSGNGTDIVVGDNSILRGQPQTSGSVSVIGTGSIEPLFTNFENYYRDNPANSGSPEFSPPRASSQTTGDLSFAAGTTFAPLFTGETGSTGLFDFNSAANYPFATPPDDPENGVVPSPYGALFNWFGNVTQDGSGQLVVGGTATNGYGYDFLFGSNNVPIGGNEFQLVATDISDRTTVDIAIKLGASNQAPVIGFGLFDFRGNSNQWTIPTSGLNSTAYTTVAINLLSPSVDIAGPDDGLDLSAIAGYVFGGDQGTYNGVQNIPIAFDVDEIFTSSLPASQMQVNGTVDLGGATLGGSFRIGYTPTASEQFTIIDNDGGDAVTGTFAGVAEGGSVTIDGQGFTVSYVGGDGNDVVLTAVSGTPTEVVGREIFYNGSKFDGFSTDINASDDAAIAPDKSAYLPGGGQSTSDNITSYTRGINGIMVDVAAPAGTLTVADFTFKMSTQVGANNTPSTWDAAPAPSAFSVRAGAGVSGSDRVEIVWANNAIDNRWLEVTVEGNDAAGGNNTNTGLAESDIFYFGNRIGDANSGTATLAITNAADEIGARNNPGFGVAITNVFDFDRSGLVNAVDQIAARNNTGLLTKINISDPPAAPAADGDGDAAVASALTIPGTSGSAALPAWIARRLDSIDLNSGRVARFFERLADADTPGTQRILERVHDVVTELGLEHDLLDSLLDDLG